jgi:cell wall-associated NlpC family hydrolase
MMVMVGLVAAVTVWNGASERLELRQNGNQAGDAAPAGAVTDEGAVDGMVLTGSEAGIAVATGEPMRPLVRRVIEGDTIRSIAAEYSVSMSTILASNKLDNPDLIQPGQEIVIPPVEGVVADVQPGETLNQLATRFGVAVEDVALANALSPDPDKTIPYERVVVPGQETAERAIGIARRQDTSDGSAIAAGDDDASTSSKPSALTYEVQEGDTVGQLAAQFGVSIWTILSANSLPDADLIRPGMHLKVLAVNGIEHEIQNGESLSDIAAFYKVDLGPLIDFNGINDPDSLRVGARITIPGAERAQPGFSLAGVSTGAEPAAVAAAPSVSAPRVGAPATGAATAAARPASVAAAQRPAVQQTLAQARPAAPAAPAPAQARAPAPAPVAAAPRAAAPVAAAKPQAAAPVAQSTNRLQAAAISAPTTIASGAGGSAVVSAAMKYLGARYVFGGTSPAGFDCSGFVWYVHKALGKSVSRGLWGQLNGGPRIALSALQPGDTVFFANTYMPGLSHAGIYIGGGRFIHASDESSGVKISSLSDSYWGPRYIGASRLY